MALTETSEEGSASDEEYVVPNNNAQVVDAEAVSDDDELDCKKKDLEKICRVLGISYQAKLKEFGSKIDEERIDQALSFLRVTRDENFSQLKKLADEIVKEWEMSNTPLRRKLTILWIIYIHDSTTVDELIGQDLLSLASINKARKELSALQKERYNRYKKKYLTQKGKLTEILKELHLTGNDIEFEENKQVNLDDYKSEKRKLKNIIKKLKSDADRKDLVLEIELIKQAIYLGWRFDYIKDLIDNVKDIAMKISGSDGELVPYDGENVAHVLNKLQQSAAISAASREEKHGLRSGKAYKK